MNCSSLFQGKALPHDPPSVLTSRLLLPYPYHHHHYCFWKHQLLLLTWPGNPPPPSCVACPCYCVMKDSTHAPLPKYIKAHKAALRVNLSHLQEITSYHGGGPKLSSPPYKMHRYAVRERFGGTNRGGGSCLLCIMTRTYLPWGLVASLETTLWKRGGLQCIVRSLWAVW